MSEYTSCHKYGQRECCGAHIDAFKAHVEGFSVNLTFLNNETINIHPWIITSVDDLGDRWQVNRQNTKEYEAIEVSTLTQKSRHIYAKHHHWGSMIFHKGRSCPLK